MVWRINNDGKREQINPTIGEIWKDGRAWKILFTKGIHTEATKRRCILWQQQMIKDGLIDG